MLCRTGRRTRQSFGLLHLTLEFVGFFPKFRLKGIRVVDVLGSLVILSCRTFRVSEQVARRARNACYTHNLFLWVADDLLVKHAGCMRP